MNSPKHALRVERLFDASREKVFRAWTERDQLLRWCHFNDDWQIAEIAADVRVGGSYRFSWKGPDGQMWAEYGQYREIDPPKRLVKTCCFDFPDDFDEDETLLTVEFHERGRQTLVVIVQEGYRDAANRDSHQKGWPSFLDQLAGYLGSAERAKS